MIDSQTPPPRGGAWARRRAAASPGTKATSLGTVRVDQAAWPMPSLRARRSGINHLAGRRFELDRGHVGPQVLEPVVRPRLRREDVEDDVEVVGGDPGGLGPR